MKIEIKLALIGGAVTIIAAVLPVVLGWYGPSRLAREKSTSTSVLPSISAKNSQNQVTPSSAESLTSSGNASSKLTKVNKVPAIKQPSLATIIRNRDFKAAKKSPVFRKFVKEHYNKEIEQIDRRQMLTFWSEMAKYLVQQRQLETK